MTLKATLTAAFPEARRISNFLERDYAEGGVVISLDERPDGLWSVDAYFENGDASSLSATILDRLGSDAFGAPITVDALTETDWVAESLKTLTPVAAGRFFIHGRHDRDARRTGRIAIEIDAGQAFGTGHHPSTAGVLATLDRLIAARRFHRILDLGTGSGILAIALAKSLRSPVLASDIDPIAVRVAGENARRNNVGHLVRTIEAAGVSHPAIHRAARFDLIVANVLAEPLRRLAPELAPLITRRGTIVLSGILKHQRERVASAFTMQGLQLVSARLYEGWSVLSLRRP